MELVKCECGCYLIPFKTNDGIIMLHPVNKECPNKDMNDILEVQLSVLSEDLYKQYNEKYPPTEYDIEAVFKAYDQLTEELADQVRHHKDLIEENIQLIEDNDNCSKDLSELIKINHQLTKEKESRIIERIKRLFKVSKEVTEDSKEDS